MPISPSLSLAIGEVLTGKETPFGPGSTSAIRKTSLAGSVRVTSAGLAGDEQADRRHHGGPDKAVHHYPFDHYAAWRSERPGLASRFFVGGFGENLSTTGVREENVCVGDVFRAGSALLQVSQARRPCWKLNVRFGPRDMALRVQASGRTGWYYRVLEEGTVARGERLVLVERPNPSWPLSRLLRCLHLDTLDRETLAGMAQLRELADSWRALARWRLENGRVEDWGRRLTTPASQAEA